MFQFTAIFGLQCTDGSGTPPTINWGLPVEYQGNIMVGMHASILQLYKDGSWRGTEKCVTYNIK